MPDRSRKRPRDLNALAASIVSDATDEDKPEHEDEAKDAAAVALGRRGGLKGGRARADKLTPERRQEIARKAAAARWAASTITPIADSLSSGNVDGSDEADA